MRNAALTHPVQESGLIKFTILRTATVALLQRKEMSVLKYCFKQLRLSHLLTQALKFAVGLGA
jgi:hypothetical protein